VEDFYDKFMRYAMLPDPDGARRAPGVEMEAEVGIQDSLHFYALAY